MKESETYSAVYWTLILLLGALTLVMASGAATAQRADGNTNASVKIVQLSPDAPTMDVFIDSERVGKDLEFGDSTRYTELEPGTYQVDLASTERAEGTLLSRQITVEQGNSYILAVTNREISLDTQLIPVRSGNMNRARARIGHFSPDLVDLDANLQDGGIFPVNDLSYRQLSDYTRLEPGNYTLRAEEAGIGGVDFTSQRVSLRSGISYTLFIAGLNRGPPGQGLQVVPVAETRTTVDTGNGNDNGNGNGDGENGLWTCRVVSQPPKLEIKCRELEEP